MRALVSLYQHPLVRMSLQVTCILVIALRMPLDVVCTSPPLPETTADDGLVGYTAIRGYMHQGERKLAQFPFCGSRDD